ncbi:MAG: hypothetical protein MH252_16020 [Thermosynechococcaceae cyanobacterium MS004]|nr:hypothetical protein [Thermosynechococcaceae cyanobacterium MS004]
MDFNWAKMSKKTKIRKQQKSAKKAKTLNLWLKVEAYNQGCESSREFKLGSSSASHLARPISPRERHLNPEPLE